ncbi:helix-turn-helix transcriptional regulator [Lactobacillus sp. ESL0225]|uniref:helix-turn-helix transcriptional regulator n=1 Tax=Lactobacillus sp. ESL0225 TaxID=2069351 RepID=UPI000EFABEDB|nr:helix-turn-helix transcriptional regulator [Lactobacillus sp. ESL0225]RMC47729.1 transcriptional regulator [Lactobacillus sp. ESL0225]
MTTLELNRGFDHRLARKIGVDKAIMVSQISYWTDKNINIREGYSWVYNTAKDWQEQFDWLSIKTVQRYLKSLVKMGLLVADNFNKMRIDRTKWYRVDYEKLAEMLGESEVDAKGTTSSSQEDYQFQSKGTDSPNGKGLPVPSNNQRLPESNTKITTVYKFNSNQSQTNQSQSESQSVNSNQSVIKTEQQHQPTKSNKRYYQQYRNKQSAKSHYYKPFQKHIEKATDWSKNIAEKCDADMSSIQQYFADFEEQMFGKISPQI